MSEIRSKPKLPAPYYVRWGVMVNWLEEWGISVDEVRKMVEAETIKKHFVGECKQAKYVPEEIERELGLGR
ncbi:MAG: hypothetical protein AAGJ81_10670 [Verrucomicrobiota bacterium]